MSLNTRTAWTAGALAIAMATSSSALAGCVAPMAMSDIQVCESAYLQQVRDGLGRVGIVLSDTQEATLMALQRDQWAEPQARPPLQAKGSASSLPAAGTPGRAGRVPVGSAKPQYLP